MFLRRISKFSYFRQKKELGSAQSLHAKKKFVTAHWIFLGMLATE